MKRNWQLAIKRGIDILGAVFGLIVLFPVMTMVAAAIGLTIGRPVIFSQARPGRAGKAFRMVKFRTMTNACNSAGHLLPDAQRLTWLGRLLRKTSLDELPELWNVLRGDMSIVGPRPLLMKYLPYYTERERLRHAVRPGITGLAQVGGRNALRYDERFALDVWYVENWSLLLDARIVLLTIWAVVARKGLIVDETAEVADFDEVRRQEAAAKRRTGAFLNDRVTPSQ